MHDLKVGQLRAWKAVKSQRGDKRGGELFLLLSYSDKSKGPGGGGYWTYIDWAPGDPTSWEWESNILEWSEPVEDR